MILFQYFDFGFCFCGILSPSLEVFPSLNKFAGNISPPDTMNRYLLCWCLNSSSLKHFLHCSISLTLVACTVFIVNSIIKFPYHRNKYEVITSLKLYSSHKDTKHKVSFPRIREYSLKPHIKKFENENARVVGFPLKSYKNLPNNETKIIYLATPYFSEWNAKHYYALHLGNTSFQRYDCPVCNCHVTNDRTEIYNSDAVLFHIRDLEVFSMPSFRSNKQVWILYSMEPPWLEIRDMSRFNGIFNWTMSYRRKSEVPVKYGFIAEKPNPSILTNISMGEKQNRAVWLVSNCKTDSNREAYIKRLKQLYPVDVLGGCGKPACRPPEAKKCYSKIAKRYKFYLAFENAICQDYVSEKLFNSLEFSIIPITFGGVDYSKIVPEKSIINAMEFERPEDLGQYLWELSKDDEEYKSFFVWKSYFRSYLQPWMCDLCEKLHQHSVSKVNWDLEDWWHEGYSCRRWSDNMFSPVKNYEFPVYNFKLFD